MRLIDADALIERVKKNNDLPWNLDKMSQVVLTSVIKHAPTAYDFEKLQAETERQEAKKLIGGCEACCKRLYEGDSFYKVRLLSNRYGYGEKFLICIDCMDKLLVEGGEIK